MSWFVNDDHDQARPGPTGPFACCCAARRAARHIPAISSISTPGCWNAAAGATSAWCGGSITALPIRRDAKRRLSAYIPTNVISITDGQIYLESELFFSGQRRRSTLAVPCRRAGGAAQTKAMKKVPDRCASTWPSTVRWKRSHQFSPSWMRTPPPAHDRDA